MNFALAAPRWRFLWSLPAAAAVGRGGAAASLRHASPMGGGRAASSGLRREVGEFDESILVHLDAAYSLARYLARDREAAEDIVQEAILKAHRSFSSLRGGNAKAWLLTIVRREFIDWSNARRAGRDVFVQRRHQRLRTLSLRRRIRLKRP